MLISKFPYNFFLKAGGPPDLPFFLSAWEFYGYCYYFGSGFIISALFSSFVTISDNLKLGLFFLEGGGLAIIVFYSSEISKGIDDLSCFYSSAFSEASSSSSSFLSSI